MGDKILPYLAGIIDGEGYVGIKKVTWHMRNKAGIHSPIYSERIQIALSDKPENNEVLALFVKQFGGRVRKEKSYQSKLAAERGIKANKGIAKYIAVHKVACEILESVLPYLIIKKRQARLVLKLRESKELFHKYRYKAKRGNRLPSATIREREELYLAIKKIHGRRQKD